MGNRALILIRQHRDFPSAPIPGAAHVGRRPLFTAVLNAPVAEIWTWPSQQRIDDQPALMEAEVLHRRIHHAAHQRASTVTTDHVPRLASQQAAGCQIFVADRHFIAFLLDRKRFGPQLDGHRWPARDPLAQHSFEVRLMEAVARVPTLAADVLGTRPIEQQPPGIVDELHAGRDMHEGLHGLREVNRLQQPHDLVVKMYCTRQVIDFRCALEHKGADTLQPEKVRKHRPHGAVADDHNVRFHWRLRNRIAGHAFPVLLLDGTGSLALVPDLPPEAHLAQCHASICPRCGHFVMGPKPIFTRGLALYWLSL